MSDAWKNLHAEFAQLARALGADGALDLRPDPSLVVHLDPRVGSKGGLLGARFRVAIAKPIAPYTILLRREGGLDRAGKNMGINREVQVGDELFDKDVYIETDGQDEDVKRILGGAGVRAALRAIVSWPIESITLGGDGAVESALLPGANAIRIDIPTKLFTDIPALQGILGELSRLARELSRLEHGGPYRGDLAPNELKAPTKDRTLRGVALFFVCLAANLTGWYGLGLGHAPTFGWAAFQIGAAAGAVGWGLLVVVTILLLRGRSTSFRNVIIVAIASLPLVITGGRIAEILNEALDSSTPHVTDATAVLRSRSKGGPLSEVTLLSTNKSVNVGEPHKHAVAFTYTPQTVQATLRDGALGSPWLVQLRSKP